MFVEKKHLDYLQEYLSHNQDLLIGFGLDSLLEAIASKNLKKVVMNENADTLISQ